MTLGDFSYHFLRNKRVNLNSVLSIDESRLPIVPQAESMGQKLYLQGEPKCVI